MLNVKGVKIAHVENQRECTSDVMHNFGTFLRMGYVEVIFWEEFYALTSKCHISMKNGGILEILFEYERLKSCLMIFGNKNFFP
jgi:hypothetical protein